MCYYEFEKEDEVKIQRKITGKVRAFLFQQTDFRVSLPGSRPLFDLPGSPGKIIFFKKTRNSAFTRNDELCFKNMFFESKLAKKGKFQVHECFFPCTTQFLSNIN